MRTLEPGTYLIAGQCATGRMRVRNPVADGRAVFDGVQWREVRDFYWSRLTSFAGEMSMATLGVGVVYGQLVTFADPFRP